MNMREFKVPYVFYPHENLVARYEVWEDPLGGWAVVCRQPNTFASVHQKATVLKGRIATKHEAEEWRVRFMAGKVRPTFA